MSWASPGGQPGAPARAAGRPFGAIDRNVAGLALLFVIEAVVFYSQLATRFTPFHPANFDQIGFMLQTYRLVDAFQARGWSALAAPFIHPGAATGINFAVQGALLSLVGGANRTAMLSLNLIYFIALQSVLFTTVRDRLGSAAFAWIAIALLLSALAPFNYAGGIFDFRLDYSALCLYGIWVCVVLRSDGFRDFRFALIVSAVGIWLVLLRSITVVYLGAVFGGLLVAVLLAVRLAGPRRAELSRMARNLFVSGALVALAVLPFFYAARRLLYDYYGIGHLLGNEKAIRAAELGIGSLVEHLIFYPDNLIWSQLGPLTLWLMGILVGLSVLAALALERASLKERMSRIGRRGFDLLALALSIFLPLAILTLDHSKSSVVGGIVLVPVILAVVILCASLWPRAVLDARYDGVVARIPVDGARLAAIVLVVVGLASFLANAAVNPRNPPVPVRESIVELNKAIASYFVGNDASNVTVSFDRVIDYLNVGTLELYGYERLGRFINFGGKLGHGAYGIFATPRETALKLVMDSDVVILTDPDIAREHPYPINTKIKEYWNELWQWANANRVLLLERDIEGIPHRVFVKPDARIGGVSGDWITSAGISVEVDTGQLARWPFIVLEGPGDEAQVQTLLSGLPKPRALVEGPDQQNVELPATFTMSGSTYSVVIDAHAIAAAAGERKRIRLTFDRSFVPSKLGINADTRELVLYRPTEHSLQAQPPE